MSREFAEALGFVLEQEGGSRVSNHASDPGGLTKWGIAQRSHPGIDIRSLTRDQAAAIYKAGYWTPCRCDRMPYPVALTVFDYAVNSGNRTAIRSLQSAAGVKADGVIGPITLRAVHRADPLALSMKVIDNRLKNYVRIIRRRPSSMAFLLGWMRRLLHLTEAL